jgi:hypothetical protein
MSIEEFPLAAVNDNSTPSPTGGVVAVWLSVDDAVGVGDPEGVGEALAVIAGAGVGSTFTFEITI